MVGGEPSLFASLEKVAPEARSTRCSRSAELADRRDDPGSGKLSGGNQQRINIAIGLLARPAALLLDEPSSGLDPRQRERLWEFVSGLAGGGTTVIFSTHNIQEAERYAGRLLVLADGERLFDGTPEELRERRSPRSRPTPVRSATSSGLRRLPPPPGATTNRCAGC